MANNNQSNTTREDKKFVLEMIEHLDFNPTMESNYMTTVDVSKMINSVFSRIFADYEGCMILPANTNDPNQMMGLPMTTDGKPKAMFNYINATVYFSDSGKTEGEGLIKNLQTFGTDANKKNPGVVPAFNDERDRMLTDMVMASNNKRKGRAYELTKKTKEALSEFISLNTDNNFWNNNVVEVSDNAQYGNRNYRIHLSVPGLDVNKLLRFIFGNVMTDSDGITHYIDYMITLIKPTSAPVPSQVYGAFGQPMAAPNQQTTYLCIVNRLDKKNLDDLCSKLGMYNYGNTVSMVRV